MIVVGITGASGVIYGIRLLEALKELHIENSLVVSDAAKIVIESETDYSIEDVIDIAEYLADSGLRVMCAGLDKDFRGEPFGVLPDLLTRAEFVTKLTAVCAKCGAPATRTQRIINGKPASFDDPVVLVGAKEAYEPRCRHCHEVVNKPFKFEKRLKR